MSKGRMQQVQTKPSERESAEEECVLPARIWAYGKQPYDCHPIRVESYTESVNDAQTLRTGFPKPVLLTDLMMAVSVRKIFVPGYSGAPLSRLGRRLRFRKKIQGGLLWLFSKERVLR